MHRKTLACGVAALTLVVCSAAQARSPWVLTGETLSGAPTVTASSCDFPDLSLSYTVEGTATGPYPGTFVETGTVAYTAIPPGPNDFTQLVASFTIESPRGLVTGTKRANAGYSCLTDGTFLDFITGREFNSYTAEIDRSRGNGNPKPKCIGGQFDASLVFGFPHPGAPPVEAFEETFISGKKVDKATCI
jgi:hypothetical protein